MHLKTILLALTATLAVTSVHATDDLNVEDINSEEALKLSLLLPGVYPRYRPPFVPMYPVFIPGRIYPGRIYPGLIRPSRVFPRHDVIAAKDEKSTKIIIEGQQQKPDIAMSGDQEFYKSIIKGPVTADLNDFEDENLDVDDLDENDDEDEESKFWNPWWYYRRRYPWGGPWSHGPWRRGPWGMRGRRT
ncbi:hypothetical protein BG004_004337 [Podila humilis]|nr:hypothetical protein BG004_004337 [Podila humilis]